MILAIFVFVVSPFYESNFTPLPIRSLSMFSNPSGLGIQTGAEAFVTYSPEPTTIMAGACASNFGFGMIRVDTFTLYEAAIGYRLPGAFTLGYAYEFGDSSGHIFGLECRPSEKLALGYTLTLGTKKHMYGGIGIMPFMDYIVLNFEIEYEGIDSIFTFYFGGRLQPVRGISAYFLANKDLHWNAGLELSLGYLKLAGMYSHDEEKFCGGVLISAQKYDTVIDL